MTVPVQSSNLTSKGEGFAVKKASKLKKPEGSPVSNRKAVKVMQELESDVDADVFAELQALVKECAAANPEADGESDDVISKKKAITMASIKPIKRQPLRAAVVDKCVQHLSSSSSNNSDGETSKNGVWNFDVDYNDHFETPLIAYNDIKPMLLALAESLGKKPDELVIYDPYYCQGGMVMMLKAMGFPKVTDCLPYILTYQLGHYNRNILIFFCFYHIFCERPYILS